MSDILFDRVIQFELGKGGGLGKKYTGLRVKFKIEKTKDSKPNKSNIQVYNLSQDNRALAEQKGTVIRLLAGYQNKPELIFSGDVDPKGSKTALQGVDYVTTFECGDGEVAYTTKSIDKTFAKGTEFKAIAQSLVQELGLTLPDVSAIASGTTLNSLSMSGMVRTQLDNMTSKLGLDWSIQDGIVQVTKKDGPTIDQAILLSASTGLIGIPRKKAEGIEFVSLLQPKIKPGRIINLQSKIISGEFVAQKVTHEGDNFGPEFFTTIEAVKR